GPDKHCSLEKIQQEVEEVTAILKENVKKIQERAGIIEILDKKAEELKEKFFGFLLFCLVFFILIVNIKSEGLMIHTGNVNNEATDSQERTEEIPVHSIGLRPLVGTCHLPSC
uniref:V-SNARE coiled-coil homology domain-containing protein n=1 Tax=Periophthalmus magnuspinnatus TaxID=409849 RepID=A0A3B3ZW10_9GOBI